MRFKELERRRILTTANSLPARGGRAFYPSPGGYQQCAAATTDGSVVFRIVSQPETQHRARYSTEGSRGAIKDRSGTGYPTVVVDGYKKETKIQVFIGNESGKVSPHMFYQVCKVTGKNSNPCEENKVDGTDIIELAAKPYNNMRLICDCIGILKERYTDIESRFPKQTSWKNTKKKSTKCRMVFRAVVQNKTGQSETLQVVSDVINCSQLPGTPEILRMSSDSSPVEGGGELWIIGKNFLKDTRVIFSYSIINKEEPLWVKVVEPLQEFFHQSHLIVRIPAFFDASFYGDTVISVSIKSGDKLSDSVSFTYKTNQVNFTFGPSIQAKAPHMNRSNTDESTKRTKGESVSVIKANHSVCKKSRPTILEPVEGKRVRSVSGPSLVNENAILVSDTSTEKPTMTSFSSTAFFVNKTENSSDNQKENEDHLQANRNLGIQEQDDSKNDEHLLSFDEEATNLDFARDSLLDENSFLSTRTDTIRHSNTDYSDTFDFHWNNKPATDDCDQTDQAIGLTPINSPKAIKDDEMQSIPNVSFEATPEEKAVISISLPTSILKDQRHFQTVLNTINNALIKQDPSEKKELIDDQKMHQTIHVDERVTCQNSEFKDKDQILSSATLFHSSEEMVNELTVDSMPMSASQPATSIAAASFPATRKRTFTGETVETLDSSPLEYIKPGPEYKSMDYNMSAEDNWTSDVYAGQSDQKSENDTKQLKSMDWSTERSIGLFEQKLDSDYQRSLPTYIEDSVASEVKEALDMIETFQQEGNKEQEHERS